MSTNSLLALAEARGVSRLCHFTPSLNLPHILRDGCVRPTSELTADVRACFEQTDLSRLDGHPDCVCCSIEYPNVYYLAQARQRGRFRSFPDWAVLLLACDVLDRPGVLFSQRNAAAGGGRNLIPSASGFLRCYETPVTGAGGATFSRSSTHLLACPTDVQAEVLVPGPIGINDLIGVVFPSITQARSELARLRIVGLSLGDRTLIIAPAMFERDALRRAIQGGRRPEEVQWNEGDRHG